MFVSVWAWWRSRCSVSIIRERSEWKRKESVIPGRKAGGHAFHLCKNFVCFACLVFQCFLAVRVIDSQFVCLARCPWLAKVLWVRA
jgi:hypothetical protein